MFTSTSVFKCLSLLALAGSVSAHGFPSFVEIDGKHYPGASGSTSFSGNFKGNPSSSPFRKISTPDPVKSVTGDDIVCGPDSQLSTVTADAKPGSSITVGWMGGTGINWFHNVGPYMVFMAKCDGPCSSFKPSGSTKWFKVNQQGVTNGQWAQAKTLSGSPLTFKLPSGISNGEYLIRTELIALQNAINLNGAEYYPSCMQVKVSGGSSSGSPSSTVNFPGAYKATDPGLKVDVYTNLKNYQFPGGQVATFGGSSDGGDSSGDDSGSSGSDSGSSDSNPAPSSSEQGAPAASSSPVGNVGSAPTSEAATASPSKSTESAAPTASSTGKPGKGSGSCKSKKRSVVAKAALSAHKKRRMEVSF